MANSVNRNIVRGDKLVMNDGRVFIANGVGPGRRAGSVGNSLYGHYAGHEDAVPAVEVAGTDIDPTATMERFASHNAWDPIESSDLESKRLKLVRELEAVLMADARLPTDHVALVAHYTRAASCASEIAETYLHEKDYHSAVGWLYSAQSCISGALTSCEILCDHSTSRENS